MLTTPSRNSDRLLERAEQPSADAMRLHPFYQGKIETAIKSCIRSLDDFAIWYTPGVAAACEAIAAEIPPDRPGKTLIFAARDSHADDVVRLLTKALQDEYTAKRYHQPDDEYDPNWNFVGQIRDWQLLHNVGYRLANSNEWPNWSQDSEFRATRDESAGERSGPAPGERG